MNSEFDSCKSAIYATNDFPIVLLPGSYFPKRFATQSGSAVSHTKETAIQTDL